MKCNICGNDQFLDMRKRKMVRCSRCNSLERTRLIGLFIQHYKLAGKDTKVLHIAPEKGLAEYLYGVAADNCTFVDICPEAYEFVPNMKRIDLCRDLHSIRDESFDLIVHSHVMEHIPCNYTYVLHQLHRILSKKGRMVCSIPFMSGYYDCCTSPKIGKEERISRFGQHDHVRRFGTSDLDMSLGKIYKMDDEYDVTKHFSEDTLLNFNIPKQTWRGYSPSSVLCLKKEDYLLNGDYSNQKKKVTISGKLSSFIHSKKTNKNLSSIDDQL